MIIVLFKLLLLLLLVIFTFNLQTCNFRMRSKPSESIFNVFAPLRRRFVETMFQEHDEDPLESLPGTGGAGHGHPATSFMLSNGAMFNLTEAGVRAMLKRPATPRGKPLMEITCAGCGKTTWSPDRFLKGDYQEWYS